MNTIEMGQVIVILACVVISSSFIIFRFIKFMMLYIMGKDWDDFDDCAIVEQEFTLGTHPGAIVFDGVLYMLGSIVIGLGWVVTLPGITIWYVSYKLRNYHLRQYEVLAKLKGE